MTTTVTAKIQIRKGTAAAWTSENPTLLAGEIGYETDTRKQKIGDGVTAWTSLAYYYDPSGVVTDHGILTGLSDDDHSQYHTDARGDARYAVIAHAHTGTYEPVDATILRQADVDDTPVNGVTTAPVSSNWAYDHAALATAHGITTFGASLVDDEDAGTARTTLGLGTAATTAATDYAVAAKGVTNGDSHDHSGGDGAQISYANLSNLPTLGTAAATDATAYATAAHNHTGTYVAAGADAADLTSGTATDGHVLTADGAGGAAWEAVPDAYAGAAAEIHAASGKTTPVDADELALVDSAASNVLKKLTWANLTATLQADPVWIQARLLSATAFGAL